MGKYSSSLGLYVYDRLADVEEERRKMMSRAETIKKEPLLRKDILLGVAYILNIALTMLVW
ncbi:MAG: hypothetical protein R2753_12115 [Chitinophagales bacterium]